MWNGETETNTDTEQAMDAQTSRVLLKNCLQLENSFTHLKALLQSQGLQLLQVWGGLGVEGTLLALAINSLRARPSLLSASPDNVSAQLSFINIGSQELTHSAAASPGDPCRARDQDKRTSQALPRYYCCE